MTEKSNRTLTWHSRQSVKKEIAKTWLAGNFSTSLVIPKKLARDYGIEAPSHVVLECWPAGILVRKLSVAELS